ncbi:MAG: histidinal dehydrogenase / histidinol dehydrogenase [Pseudomonadota bacterium]
MIKIINTDSIDFPIAFKSILARGDMQSDSVEEIVKNILKDVAQYGDEALIESAEKFDKWIPKSINDLLIPEEDCKKAYEELEESVKSALHFAYERIKKYHEKLKPTSWLDYEANGSILGQKVTPVERAGIYIPGGKAVYPSSLLMNAIPAIVAGVDEIIACTPTQNNEPNALLLAAAYLCGVKKIYKIGGASAIGAMAYGTNSIPKCDVITGPGNIFVATAKKLVYGKVNIDMIAGPSEVGVLADDSANIDFLALDLLSQAEHDEMASCFLLTPSQELANKAQAKIEEYLEKLPRSEISRKSIDNNSYIIVCKNMDEAVDLMNKIAPEHLEISTQSPFELLPKIKNAGAIFLGHYTPESLGDYVAGPNHTLPTGGTARFYSPLSTEHFMKKSSIIYFSKDGFQEAAAATATIAKIEGLIAHEQSALIRINTKGK